MADPLTILPFGGCQLGFGLRSLMAKHGAIVSTRAAGINSATYTMAETLQIMRFVRGDVEVPRHLRYFCNLPEEAVAGSTQLRLMEQADVVLLEPNTTLEVFFGPYALHRANLLTGLLDPVSKESDELRAAATAWFNDGLFGQSRAAQREAARALIPALPGHLAEPDVARRILLDARVEEQSFSRYAASVVEFCDMLEPPIGLVTFVYGYLPDGRPVGWPADFLENTLKIADMLMLPVFDSVEMVTRFGLDVCLDAQRSLYREEFWPVFGDQLFEFVHSLRGSRRDRTASARFRTLSLVNDWSGEVPDAVAPLRGENCFDDAAGPDSKPWGSFGAHWAREAGSAPGGLVALNLREEAVRRTHDFRRVVAKPSEPDEYVLSFMVKPDQVSRLQLWMGSRALSERAQASLDLSLGQVARIRSQGRGWKTLDAGLVSLEDGWWWCWMAACTDDSPDIAVLIALETEDGDVEYAGEDRSAAWFASLRLEKGRVPTLSLAEGRLHLSRAVVRPLRSENWLGDRVDLGTAEWGIYGAHWAGTAIGPGGIIARKLREDAVRRSHDFRRSVAMALERQDCVLSFMARPDERADIQAWLGAPSQADRAEMSLDLALGRVMRLGRQGSGWLARDAGLVSLEDGWWWCWMAVRIDSCQAVAVQIALETEHGVLDYPGDGASGAWFANVRLEAGLVPTLAWPRPSRMSMGRLLAGLDRRLVRARSADRRGRSEDQPAG